jgi:hypothetical protein
LTLPTSHHFLCKWQLSFLKRKFKLGTGGSCLLSQAIWEAEIRRITVPGQQGQKIRPYLSEKGREWWCMPVIPLKAGSLKYED